MMWQGNSWSSMGSYLRVMLEIHVLLVDHDREDQTKAANLLQMCQYKVTSVDLASVAISLLSSGKSKFDIVMANINSPDLLGFKLVQQAVNMDLLIILISLEDNSFMTMTAIQKGAYMCIKKPAPLEMLRCLWQHVVFKEKMRPVIRNGVIEANYNAFRDFVLDENPNYDIINGVRSNNMVEGKSKKNVRKRDDGLNEDDEEYGFENNRIKRKVCTEWTSELHEKFMAAVEQLGEGRCFPKDILEIMNVPGLTRMQVASHLQKCRNDNWRPPEERQPHLATQPVSTDSSGPQHKPIRFGSKPRLGKTSSCNVSSEAGEGSQAHNGTDTSNTGGVGNNETTAIATNIGSRMNHLDSSSGEYRLNPPVFNDHTSTLGSTDISSQMSSGTSNVGNDEDSN